MRNCLDFNIIQLTNNVFSCTNLSSDANNGTFKIQFFCKNRGYNRFFVSLYSPNHDFFRGVNGIYPYINVMTNPHQLADNFYSSDFTELKNYLAACNAYEEPCLAWQYV